jgi:hypothetical protein
MKLALLMLLASCAAPGPNMHTGNPACWQHCVVTINLITGNKADQVNPTLGDVTTTATKTSGP